MMMMEKNEVLENGEDDKQQQEEEEVIRSRHRKEIKQWDGEKRAAIKKIKTTTKGKKLKDVMATYVNIAMKQNGCICNVVY